MTEIYIEGKIILNDDKKTEVKFNLSNTESWNQWGNIEDKLWDTMDIVETLQNALCEKHSHYEEEVA